MLVGRRDFYGDNISSFPGPLPVVYYHDIQPKLDAADFVEGLLIAASMCVVYGQSNSGKTFFVLALALAVAAGHPWAGRDVEHGGVLWLAMEGSHGISNRVSAWREENGFDSGAIHFAVIPVALNLLDPTADIEKLVPAIRTVATAMGVPIKLVVIDTLSRAIAGGNENSPEDMGAIVTNGTRIQQEIDAAVLWIHHSGKDEAKGARGHSLLRAATDTEIEIAAEDGGHVARVTKQREMECAGEFAFTLKVVELGKDRRGKAVTSCVVVHSGADQRRAPQPLTRLAGHARRAYDVLIDCLSQSGQQGYPGTPGGVLTVPDKWWRERFYDRAMPAEDQATKQKAFKRASETLINTRLVGLNKGRVWICTHVSTGQSPRQEPGHEGT